MSSYLRKIELKILRQKKKVPARHKATAKRRGMPFRHCKLYQNEQGEVTHWIRYH